VQTGDKQSSFCEQRVMKHSCAFRNFRAEAGLAGCTLSPAGMTAGGTEESREATPLKATLWTPQDD
jgi:hypothetical protein